MKTIVCCTPGAFWTNVNMKQGSHQQTVQKKDGQGSSHLSRGRCKQAKLKFQYYQSCWSLHA